MKWTFRRVLLFSLLTAFVLAIPSLWMGFLVDDYIHLAIIEGYSFIAKPMDLYRFTSGNPDELRPFLDAGPLPWWALPELKVAFLRPLTCLLANFDHALFGRRPMGWHLHSVLWYLILITGVAYLFRRSLSFPVAALGLILYAWDEAHWFPVAWIANRNALIACAPALWGLLAHMRWREEGWRMGLPLSLLGYAAGLAGGEMGMGIFAYLTCYEFLGRNDAWTKRFMALVPAGLLAVLYLGVHSFLGYGAYGSGLYVDPASEPVMFLVNAPGRILALIAAQILAVSADVWALLEILRPLQMVMGGVALLSLIVVWRALGTLSNPLDRRALRWMLPGACLSLVPVLATFPANRLLLLPSLGACVLVASLLSTWWAQRKLRKIPRGPSALCWILAFLHLALPLALWPAQSVIMRAAMKEVEGTYMSADLDKRRLAELDVILYVAYDPLTAVYPPIFWIAGGYPTPRSWHCLSSAPFDHRFTRTSPTRLDMEVVGGSLMGTEFERLMRGPQHPFKEGDVVSLKCMTVTIEEMGRKGPRRVSFEFNRPLEELTILVWKDRKIQRAQPPAVGEYFVLTKVKGAF